MNGVSTGICEMCMFTKNERVTPVKAFSELYPSISGFVRLLEFQLEKLEDIICESFISIHENMLAYLITWCVING